MYGPIDPPSPGVPRRPRLSAHVAVRRHVVDGSVVVALHDRQTDRVATVGEREWTLLSMADGTRDLVGILAAAARVGRHASEAHLSRFLEQLAAAGMIVEGPSPPPAQPEPRHAEGRPLRAFPDFQLRCDGRGTCCRIYPTTTFSPREVLVALTHAGCAHERERFTPSEGSERLPWGGRAVTMVDGRCAFLDDDRRCRLHAQGGAEAKPLGCRRFPVQLVDDGREVRVAVAPECACVFSSALDASALDASALDASALDASAPGASSLGASSLDARAPDARAPAPLLTPWPAHAGELEPETHVATLPAEVVLTRDRTVSREDYLAWSDDLIQDFAGHEGDVPRWLWSHAAQLERASRPARRDEPAATHETASSAHDAPRDEPDPSMATLERDLIASRVELVAALDERIALSAWRSEHDLARCLPRWLREALDAPLAVAERPADPAERFFVRALSFAHAFAQSDGPVAGQLRRRAQQIWLARRLAEHLASAPDVPPDPAFSHPLALVAAFARAFAL